MPTPALRPIAGCLLLAAALLQAAEPPPGDGPWVVRGRAASLNWGPVSAVFVDVATPVELQGFTIE